MGRQNVSIQKKAENRGKIVQREIMCQVTGCTRRARVKVRDTYGCMDHRVALITRTIKVAPKKE